MSSAQVHILGSADYQVMPWRNGGGKTTEIAIETGNDADCPFLWRVSLADVAASGPFSKFEDCDRQIMMIAGNGMKLAVTDHDDLALDQPFQPVRFSGDWQVTGELNDGPVKDFNLIYNRKYVSGSLTMENTATIAANISKQCSIILIYNFSEQPLSAELDGSISYVVKQHETLVCRNFSSDFSADFSQDTPNHHLALIQITPAV